MLSDVKEAFARSSGTFFQDAIGAGALLIMLFVGLMVPGLF
ncbi:hypothetical protein [Pseudaestuariivita rosea]|nr:hypothetical protein [Pseudaestuariivita rosea]